MPWPRPQHNSILSNPLLHPQKPRPDPTTFSHPRTLLPTPTILSTSSTINNLLLLLPQVLGFDACPYLDPADHAVLAAVEKYAKFRQGEVWRAIQAQFAESGVKPTAPDRWGRH